MREKGKRRGIGYTYDMTDLELLSDSPKENATKGDLLKRLYKLLHDRLEIWQARIEFDDIIWHHTSAGQMVKTIDLLPQSVTELRSRSFDNNPDIVLLAKKEPHLLYADFRINLREYLEKLDRINYKLKGKVFGKDVRLTQQELRVDHLPNGVFQINSDIQYIGIPITLGSTLDFHTLRVFKTKGMPTSITFFPLPPDIP